MFSSQTLQGAICLSWKTQLWHFCMKTLPPWEAAGHQPFLLPAAALTRQPPWNTTPRRQQSLQELGAACSKAFSLLKRAKQFPKAASHRELAMVAAAPLEGGSPLERVWDQRGLFTWGAQIPHHWLQWAAQNLTPASLFSSATGPRDSSPCHLFLSLSYESDFRCLRTALWALAFPLDFPCHALLYFIFKPDRYFLFSLCFNTQALDNQTWDWLYATSVLSQAKFHSICGTTCQRERETFW